MVNGQIKPRFKIEIGCRQGYPLSPYLFLLCLEILGIVIRNSQSVKGICVETKEFKILQYADDTALFLDGSNVSFRNVLHIFYSFGDSSGLKVNENKTNAIWIGASKHNKDIEVDGRQIKYVYNDFFHYLGTDFHTVIAKIPDYNYDRIFDKVKRQMISWVKQYYGFRKSYSC